MVRVLRALAPDLDALAPAERTVALQAIWRGDIVLLQGRHTTEARIITFEGITTIGHFDNLDP